MIIEYHYQKQREVERESGGLCPVLGQHRIKIIKTMIMYMICKTVLVNIKILSFGVVRNDIWLTARVW